MVFNRQRQLLEMLDALGGDIGGLDFQKLLFLFCEEQDDPPYAFVPYRFGGFSFTSYADKRKLIEKGLLENQEKRWVLTDAGRGLSRESAKSHAATREFAHRNKARGDALVADIYRRFPFYAIRSEMADRVLQGDKAALSAIRRAKPKKGQAGISTIGYEGLCLEDYLNRLLKDGVTLLCDVRKNPLSRKYGFSKSTLSKGCEGVGIRYEHLPELGISSEARRGLKTQADYDELFETYEMESLPFQTEALDQIKKWVEEGQRVALTCFEHAPEQCHRHCVADALEQKFGAKYRPKHL